MMYGVPADLSIGFLHGTELIQVCIGLQQVQFHFHPVGSISVMGGWILFAANGECIDRCDDRPDRPPYELHRLLGHRVVTTEVSAPEWFTLRFESGEVLRVFDNSTQHESFSIQPGNFFV